MQLVTRTELYYYLRRIHELEACTNYAFEHFSDVKEYVANKLLELERSVVEDEDGARKACYEIAQWRELY